MGLVEPMHPRQMSCIAMSKLERRFIELLGEEFMPLTACCSDFIYWVLLVLSLNDVTD